MNKTINSPINLDLEPAFVLLLTCRTQDIQSPILKLPKINEKIVHFMACNWSFPKFKKSKPMVHSIDSHNFLIFSLIFWLELVRSWGSLYWIPFLFF